MNLAKGIKLFAILCSATISLVVQGQSTDEVNYNLALDFFQNKEYDKSISLFEELYKKDKSQRIYIPYFNSFLGIENYVEAENLVKKQLKKNNSDPVYIVDYGFVVKLSGNQRKAKEIYEDAIKDVLPRTQDVLDLSNSFQRRNELDYAIETLKYGKKLTPSYGYQFELAELYYQKGDIETMVNEYLNLLSINEGYLQNVQNALNTAIYQDLNQQYIEVLNTALLRNIQKNPDEVIYSELLIWHYLQQKDFKGAIVQSKALDKRNQENGNRFLTLGKLCSSNRKYDLAMECYQYLIDKGPSSRLYINARVLMTETIREKIISTPYTDEDIAVLEQNYIQTLDEIGRTGATMSLQIGLAEIWAFYLDKPDQATAMLKKALGTFQLAEKDKARCKLLLADIYLRQGEIWEASLLYSQVEKDYKYEALGDQAKFKNAKIYFYTGDYNWAKAQLDVLKGSTSKLIANDAMRLSLIISDNLAFDTAGAALRDYAKASLQFEQNDLNGALNSLQSMERIYLAHSIIDEVYYLEYSIYFNMQNYEKAAAALNVIVRDYPEDILGDEAVFNLAVLYEQYLNQPEKAKEMYKKLISVYPGSIHVAESRKRYRAYENGKGELKFEEADPK